MRTPTRLLLVALLVFAACKEKTTEELAQDVVVCSRANSQAELIALCLETDHHWADTAAQRAGRARQHELDSIAAWREDSAWNTDSTIHRADVRACSSGDQMRECLKLKGWPDDRATAKADSAWNRDTARHLLQVRNCTNRREGPVAACLVLWYKWNNERAMATQDSVMRARLAP